MYFRIGSREKFVGLVSSGLGAVAGELLTEIAVVHDRVWVMFVRPLLTVRPVVLLLMVRPAVQVWVLPDRVPTLLLPS